MKVPSLESVYESLDKMCIDGKMDTKTQDFYDDPANIETVVTSSDMLLFDELLADMENDEPTNIIIH